MGCPCDVGSGFRDRIGCAPYVEFVTDCVLRRAIVEGKEEGGPSGEAETLYFATPADKARVISRALEVVNAVLVHNVVPTRSDLTIPFDNQVLQPEHAHQRRRGQITSSVHEK